MARTLTMEQASVAMRDFAKQVIKETLVPFRKALSAGRKEAIDGYRGTGVGRALWGKTTRQQSGVPPIILKLSPPARFSRTHHGFIGGYAAKGMAALIETGGRTKRHLMRPVKGDFLVFDGRAGTVFWGGGTHPGGPVGRDPQLQKAMDKAAERMVPVLDATYARISASVL